MRWLSAAHPSRGLSVNGELSVLPPLACRPDAPNAPVCRRSPVVFLAVFLLFFMSGFLVDGGLRKLQLGLTL